MGQKLIIGDHNFHLPHIMDGGAKGAVPRDFSVDPKPMQSVSFPLIPRAEWPQRIKDMKSTKSRNSDVRNRGMDGQPIPSRDQGQKGYCWAHSWVSSALVTRARSNMAFADLSAYMIACLVKNYRDEGGWCGLSLKFAAENGCATSATWPQQSMSRGNDNAAMRAEAAKFKPTDSWVDLAADVWDQSMTFDQLATLLLSRIVPQVDFNWWSHSVCALDLVDGSAQRDEFRGENGKIPSIEEFDAMFATGHEVTGGFGIDIWNSWGDGWSNNGVGTLTGNKAIPDGCVATVAMKA